ncbi:MAG TPA: biotin synthase BioB [Candidatus Paenalcaligenes intestinipullorum]|uniref:Biotin synthase n=1 Tax=Candidatus Paenalcaligenes intestinipullorum TaxID=2838718 RepID=A0A9D2RG66_9BURK|nr:biotin synthase BioB [Candidatus Paenalcaligenes intestinipullorum]
MSPRTTPREQKGWHPTEILALYELPFMDLLWRAHDVHRQHHDVNSVQLSSLLSIKTGGCPEDCTYCPQSSRYQTDVEKERILSVDVVREAAKAAQAGGASRFCMGAAWRSPTEAQLDQVIDMIKEVKSLGMEACVTLGMLKDGQAERLKEAGLDYYNHNLDTAEEFYSEIITTRRYQDRIDTLDRVQKAGLNTCSGGIVGLGESRAQRAQFIAQLANRKPYPESVPINQLVRVKGTPLADNDEFDEFEFVRTIAVARITMPKAAVRLSAGRSSMSDSTQALCFFAGANSIFYGEQLLTTGNPQFAADQALFARLNLHSPTPRTYPHPDLAIPENCPKRQTATEPASLLEYL